MTYTTYVDKTMLYLERQLFQSPPYVFSKCITYVFLGNKFLALAWVMEDMVSVVSCQESSNSGSKVSSHLGSVRPRSLSQITGSSRAYISRTGKMLNRSAASMLCISVGKSRELVYVFVSLFFTDMQWSAYTRF